MESPAKHSGGQRSGFAEVRRNAPTGGKEAISALEVSDVVRYGSGPRSRIDLTIGSGDRRIRITGLLTKHVLSYRLVAQSAVQEGLVLPYYRFADREWRKVLERAMEQAREEPWHEGEEIAEAVVAEIRARLEEGPRGESASDLMRGKVVKRASASGSPGGECLLVSPRALVIAVRDRLVDDVLSRETIDEAARKHLGMTPTRPAFPDGQPRAWAFPLPLAAVREPQEVRVGAHHVANDGIDEPARSEPVEDAVALEMHNPRADAVEAVRIRFMNPRAGVGSLLGSERSKTGSDGRQKTDFPRDPASPRIAGGVSPLPTEGWDRDPICHEKSNFTLDPVHGPEVEAEISSGDRDMRPGSSGPAEKNLQPAGPAEEVWAQAASPLTGGEMPTGSNGRQNGAPKR